MRHIFPYGNEELCDLIFDYSYNTMQWTFIKRYYHACMTQKHWLIWLLSMVEVQPITMSRCFFWRATAAATEYAIAKLEVFKCQHLNHLRTIIIARKVLQQHFVNVINIQTLPLCCKRSIWAWQRHLAHYACISIS